MRSGPLAGARKRRSPASVTDPFRRPRAADRLPGFHDRVERRSIVTLQHVGERRIPGLLRFVVELVAHKLCGMGRPLKTLMKCD
jgi:hypothetical protein